MWIHPKKREPFAFAGLWDYWRDHSSGEELYSFTIITMQANALLQPIHNRMPVIYDGEMGAQWLDQSFGDRAMTLAAASRLTDARSLYHQPTSFQFDKRP
jgi:putative SOS response-associated peptidase YedK